MTFEEFLKCFQYVYRQSDGRYSKGTTFSYKLDESKLKSKDNPVLIWIESSGGASGGNCWGGEAETYYNPVEFKYEELDTFLEKYFPDISFLKYKKIQNLIKSDSWSDIEYYGNYTDYEARYLELKVLYKVLYESSN